MLIDRETFEVNISPWAELRLNRSRNVDRTLHIQLLDASFHNGELDGNDTRHLDRATERDLTIALREVQVSNTELCALDMNGKKNLRPTTQVLDIAVAAVFRSSGNRPRTFLSNLLFQLRISRASMHVLGLWRLGDNAVVRVGAGFYELAFTLVPGREDFSRGRAAKDTRVDQSGKAYAGDVARGAENALEIPDGFCSGSSVNGISMLKG